MRGLLPMYIQRKSTEWDTLGGILLSSLQIPMPLMRDLKESRWHSEYPLLLEWVRACCLVAKTRRTFGNQLLGISNPNNEIGKMQGIFTELEIFAPQIRSNGSHPRPNPTGISCT